MQEKLKNSANKIKKIFSGLNRLSRFKKNGGFGRSLKLSQKLILSFVAIFIILLVIGGMAILTANQLQNSTRQMYEENLLSAVDMMEVARLFESLNSNIASAVLGREEGMEEQIALVNQLRADLQSRVDAISNSAEANTYEKFDTFVLLWENYSQNMEYLLSIVGGEQQFREGVDWRDVAITNYNSMLLPQVKTLNDIIQMWVDRVNQEAQEQYMQSAEYQNKLALILIIMTVVAVLIMVLLSWLLLRSIRNPLTHLADRLNRLAEGDLRGEALQVTTNDEIGRLSLSFNQMNQSLGELIREVSQSAEQVAATAQQLTSHTKEISGITEEVTQSIQQIASGAEAQVSGAEQSASGMDEISIKINNIAETVNEVEESARDMASRAEQGDRSIEQVSDQMAMIGQSMQNAASVIAELTKSAAQISQISSAISDISSQTNLLALNASIEAARAGEAGRGFAVVADEVKKLANQAAESAKEVTKLITQMQSNTSQVVQEMNKVAEDFEAGQSLVEAARQQFGSILMAARQVSQQVEGIVTATQEMASSSTQVVERIKETEQIAKEASVNIQNVSASSEEQLAFMQEIQASADTLSNMAASLHQLIGRFRTSDDVQADAPDQPEPSQSSSHQNYELAST
jgi:methyl-accepting chemotaxis protein